MNALQKIKGSLKACAGDIVFGMEDGTVSIFGLVFGVAATTTDKAAILIAGSTAAASAAVSMMAGVYMEAQTDQAMGAKTSPPSVRAGWMLLSDFAAAAIPIIPFGFLPIAPARWVAGTMTLGLLLALGYGRYRIEGGRPAAKMLETAGIGVAAALAGIGIGLGVSHLLGR